MTALLTTRGLSRRFQGLVAVDRVGLEVAEGGIHAVIGPNGAGKTTLFNLISGLIRPTAGRIVFAGSDLTDVPASARAGAGIARTFQNIRLFAEMTVLENVLTGMHAHLHASPWSLLTRGAGARAEERAAAARARDLLAEVGLEAMAGRPAGDLAYGDQRRLEIARALAGQPRLVLLDEPAAGMNPAETRALAAALRRIAAKGVTLLLVEHDMGFVMDVCQRITVLNFGRLIAEGSPREIRRDGAVIEAYLGPKLAQRLAAGGNVG